MNVLIHTLGTAGDVHPFIAVGQRLRQRGHAVVLVANPVFGDRVLGAGLGFVPSGTVEEYRRVVGNPLFVHRSRSLTFAFNNLVAGAVEQTVAVMRRTIAEFKPDVVLRHHISFGAQWACDEAGVPTVVAVLSPVSWLSTDMPCTYGWLRLQHPPRWWARVYKRLSRLTGRVIVDRRINATARRLGYPARRDVFFHETLGGRANLALWSPLFRPPATDDPPHGRICGFCHFDGAPPAAGDEGAHRLEEFLHSGPSPVVFTLGSSVVHTPGAFYRVAAAACAGLGLRAVMLVGPQAQGGGGGGLAGVASASVGVFGYAPFSTLFPRAAAVVHHGGIGTTARAMLAGRPTVIVPFANDEFDNAKRARLLGVSQTIDAHRLTVRRLGDALQRVLDGPGVAGAAERIAAGLVKEDGPGAAVAEIERVAGAATVSPQRDATSAAAR